MAVHIQNLCIELLTSKWYSPILHYRDNFWSTVSELYIKLFVILWYCPLQKNDKFIQCCPSHTTGERPLRTDWHQLKYWDSWKKRLPSNLLLNDNDWPFMSCGWAVQVPQPVIVRPYIGSVPTSLTNYQPTIANPSALSNSPDLWVQFEREPSACPGDQGSSCKVPRQRKWSG